MPGGYCRRWTPDIAEIGRRFLACPDRLTLCLFFDRQLTFSLQVRPDGRVQLVLCQCVRTGVGLGHGRSQGLQAGVSKTTCNLWFSISTVRAYVPAQEVVRNGTVKLHSPYITI